LTARLILVLLGLFLSTAGAAQAPSHPDCGDDTGTDRCAPAQQARVRALFGVQPIEAHRDAGDQVRRAFYVDGYGHDVVAITFIRAPGHEPEVRVHFPRPVAVPLLAALTAPVPQMVWDDIIRRSAFIDRRLDQFPEPTPQSDVITLCIHSWIYTIEATDPAGQAGSAPALRRRTEDGCANGLTEAYANEIDRAALALLPQCAALDPSQHRNEASALLACGILGGDRMAAAGARNAIGPLLHARRAEDADSIAGLFDFETVMDWNGERRTRLDPQVAARWWIAKALEPESSGFFLDNIDGLTAVRVRVRGRFARWVEAPGQPDRVLEAARAELILTASNGSFRIASATIGRFERVRR